MRHITVVFLLLVVSIWSQCECVLASSNSNAQPTIPEIERNANAVKRHKASAGKREVDSITNSPAEEAGIVKKMLGVFQRSKELVSTQGDKQGKWDRIITMGDLHGDMIQGTKLMTDLGIISHQPNYYKDMLAKWARQDQVRAAKGLTPRKRRSAYAKDGVSNELQAQDIAANMLFNKRGDLMGGATADEFHWAGGKLLLVILGDAMNVGPDDIAILQFLRRLTREAAENKGKLVFLLGNHEMNNLKGNYLGVHPWSFEGSGGEEGRKRLLSTATRLGRFVRSSPGIFYYDHLMFMHGGLMPETVRLVERLTGHHNMTGKEFAKTVNMHVKTQLFDHENDPATIDSDEIAATVTNVDYEANGKSGILLVHPLDKCTEVEEANQLTLLQAQVVGHTPHTLPNYKFCDGSLYAMDFMLSKWKGGRDTPMAALEFTRVAIATPLGTAAPGNTSGSSDDQPKLIESSYKWSAKLLIPKAQPLDVLQEVHKISRLWFAVFVVLGVVVVEGLVVLTRHVLRLRKANSQFL